MKYRKRNPDGSFGEWVETPGHIEHLSPEMKVLFEAIVFMGEEMDVLRAELEAAKAEIEALKGGGQA